MMVLVPVSDVITLVSRYKKKLSLEKKNKIRALGSRNFNVLNSVPEETARKIYRMIRLTVKIVVAVVFIILLIVDKREYLYLCIIPIIVISLISLLQEIFFKSYVNLFFLYIYPFFSKLNLENLPEYPYYSIQILQVDCLFTVISLTQKQPQGSYWILDNR